MTFVSYALNFEDVLLWRALNDVTAGRYIDIGAHEPVVDSVSLAFYEAGWRGVNIEPIPSYAAQLREARPEDCVIEAAVSDAPGPILFYELCGLSTGRSDVADHHARAGHTARQMLVATVTLDAVLKRIDGDIHWLKIDVEGMELDVLRSWGESEVRPWVLVIEATFPNSQEPTHSGWIDQVLARGYREVHFDGLSRFFVHESQIHRESAFAAPANVFDGFAVAQHHFSASGMRSMFEEAESRFRNELADAVAMREAAQAKAAAAVEGEQQVRNKLAAALAKETALVTRMLEAERDHSATIDSLWRERAAAEAKRLSEFKAVRKRLQAALDESRRRHSAVRVELATANERATSLERELTRRGQEHERDRAAANAERELYREQLESVRGSESALQAELAKLSERLEGIERDRVRADEDQQRSRAELEGELQRHKSALARADALIAKARTQPARTWDRIGIALGLSANRRTEQALSGWDSAVVLNPIQDSSSSMGDSNNEKLPRTAAPMNSGNPYLRANSLPELLAWDDADFVRCAYVTLLGRQPEPEGETYYTDRIRAGHSKTQVLWQLRHSNEGRSHDPGIAGLDRALRRARRARMRLIGAAFRFFNHEEGDGARDRRARATANEIAMLRAVQESSLNELRALGSDLRNLQTLIEAVGAKTSVAGCASMQVGSESASERGILDPVELDSARDPDEVIDTLRAAINRSREVIAFRSGRQSLQ
jgi:FkbM family methyltransferase